MFRPDIAIQVAEDLGRQPIVRRNRFTVAKLFVSPRSRGPTGWLHLGLTCADQFIRSRMAKYPNEKYGDRTRFGGDLIQYLAWQGGGEP